MVFGALIGVPIGTYFLSRLEPVTTRWIISVFVAALLLLLLSGWRYRGKDHAAISIGIGGLSGFCSGLAQTGGPPIVGYWLGRPIASVVARANIVLFFGASDFFSAVSYAATGLITMDAIRFALVVGPVYGIGVWFGASLFGKASEVLFRAICYALIAAAVLFGLPLLDGVAVMRRVQVRRAKRNPSCLDKGIDPFANPTSMTRSQYAYPSRSTRSPDVTAIRRENIGPATTQV